MKGKFNIDKLSDFINYIYKNISEHDISIIRPNNIKSLISEEKIKKSYATHGVFNTYFN